MCFQCGMTESKSPFLRKGLFRRQRNSVRSFADFRCSSGLRPAPSWGRSLTLRDYLPVSYSMINILLIGSLRSPPPIRLRRTSPRAKPGCKGFIHIGGGAAHHNPHGRRPCQSSRRNQITLSAPRRTVRAIFPHTALRIVLGYHICTRIRGFGI